MYRLQTLLDQWDFGLELMNHFWDHWHIKEIRGLLILILEELHTSLVPNWFLLWDLFKYIVSCLKETLHKKWSFPLRISSVKSLMENFIFCAMKAFYPIVIVTSYTSYTYYISQTVSSQWLCSLETIEPCP